MSSIDKYMTNAPQQESETPADTLDKGEYPAEVINLKLKNVEGDSDKGHYDFTNTSVQIKVLDGAMKGQTTWIDPGLALPDSDVDPQIRARATYWVQHFYDALGLGKRLDPSWTRSERPHPTKPNKKQTIFKGKCFSKAMLKAIAENPEEVNALAEMMKGLKALFMVDIRKGTGKDGGEFEAQKFKGIRAYSDANLADWKGKQVGGGTAAAGGGGGSIYSK